MGKPTDACPNLEWLLLEGAVAMRERGTIAGVINQLECGGPGEGGRLGEDGGYIHPFTDRQLGTGKCLAGDIERHRWLSAAWFACSEATRGLLLLRHMAPRAAHRSDQGYGARDRHVEGSDSKLGRHEASRTGIEAQLGELAAVALAVYEEPGDLLKACHEYSGNAGKPEPTVSGKQAAYGRTIRRARRAAEKALEPAWAEWRESMAGADPMRRGRRARDLPYAPTEATE